MRPLGPRPAGARIALCVDAPAFPPTSARSRSRSAFRPSGRRQILRQLESGADRSGADCALRRQGRFARLRRHALGPDPLLGEGHQDRFLDHQRPGRGSRHKAGVSRGVSAAALSGAARQFLRVEEDRDGQAALRDRVEGPAADGHGRFMGNLALAGGGKNSQLHHHHHNGRS